MPQFHSGESQRRRRRIVTLPSAAAAPTLYSAQDGVLGSVGAREKEQRASERVPLLHLSFSSGRKEGASPEISREKLPSPTRQRPPARVRPPAGRSSGFLIFREGRRSVETVPRGLSPLPFSRPPQTGGRKGGREGGIAKLEMRRQCGGRSGRG